MAGMMGKKPPPVIPPEPQPVAPAPDEQGPEMRERSRRQMAAMSKGGRRATLLSSENDGMDYSGKTLGG